MHEGSICIIAPYYSPYLHRKVHHAAILFTAYPAWTGNTHTTTLVLYCKNSHEVLLAGQFMVKAYEDDSTRFIGASVLRAV